ncbi:hypothetical protein [Solidesulfovibrio alcoholivorans]|uniref:hypothetical protein n=1 Tax=Solidesulfovibrio alcoholivorans TaxID=81406 RepID=UPI0012EC61DF|nr:hypothetical protein [Solidesulfovibrio alcoholivorans]
MQALFHAIMATITIILTLTSSHAHADTIPYNSDYNAIKEQLSTPQAAAAYMAAYFTYDTNRPGYMPYSPATLNTLKTGDCKDYATFFASILVSHGYAIKKYAFRYNTSNNYGHIVTLFTDTDGKQYVASNHGNAQEIFGPVTSLDEAGSFLLAGGVLPSGSVADDWLEYPPEFTGYLQHSNGFLYNADYQTAKSQLQYFQHPASYMTAFFTAQTHPGANAYAPAELNSRKTGDAKDFAVFNAQNVYGSSIHSFRCNQRTNAGHVISSNTYNSKYYVQSNQYFFGPLDALTDVIPLLKENGHIPADCTADNWQSYSSTYTGPFPVATVPSPPAASLLLLEQ